MNAIQQMVQKETVTLLGRITRRYGRIVTSSLIGAVAFLILFFAISDGFRESPAGAVLGLILMLTVTAVAWRRYRQVTTGEYSGTLRERLQQLLAQTRRNLLEEQLLVVGLPIIFLIVSRVVNGRGLTGLTTPGTLLGLGAMAAFTVGLLVVMRRRYQHDIESLQGLLDQLE